MKILRCNMTAGVAIAAALCATVTVADALSNAAHAYAQRSRTCTAPGSASEVSGKPWMCDGAETEVTIHPGKTYHVHLHCYTTDGQEGWVHDAIIQNAHHVTWKKHSDADMKQVWFSVSHGHTRHVTFQIRCGIR